MKIFLTLLVGFFFIGCEGFSENNDSLFDNPGQISVKVVSEDEKHNSNQNTNASNTAGTNESSQKKEVPVRTNETHRSSQSKILSDTNESSQSTHSSSVNKETEQTQKNKYYLGSEGVIKINVKYNFKTHYASVSTGFFVDAHTVITSYHSLFGFKGHVSDNVFIVHPETKYIIPVQSIRALDIGNDLAILHVSQYESPFYYSKELYKSSVQYPPPAHAYVFDHNQELSPKLEGPLVPQNSFKNSFRKIFSIFSFNEGQDDAQGLSGSPVFSTDGKVIGVLIGNDLGSFYNQMIFSDIQHVNKLLSKPSLNCVSDSCIQEAIQSIQSKEAQYIQGIVETGEIENVKRRASQSEQQHLLSKLDPYSWFEKSADQDYGPALYQIAFYHHNVAEFNEASLQNDFDRLENRQIVDEFLKRSAQQNYGAAQVTLGQSLIESGSFYFEEGMEWVRKAFAHGHLIPMSILYNLVDRWIISLEAYYDYLEEFSNKGHPDAQVTLARALLEDERLDRNKDAIQFLSKAADINYPPAVDELIRIYDEGLYGEEQNIEKVRSLKQKATELRKPIRLKDYSS